MAVPLDVVRVMLSPSPRKTDGATNLKSVVVLLEDHAGVTRSLSVMMAFGSDVDVNGTTVLVRALTETVVI